MDVIQKVIKDEAFMNFDSHVEFAEFLKEALNISEIAICPLVQTEFEKVRSTRKHPGMWSKERKHEKNQKYTTWIEPLRKEPEVFGNPDRFQGFEQSFSDRQANVVPGISN